jgi:hypothetical protein
MAEPPMWSNSAIWSGIISVSGAIMALIIKEWFDRRKARDLNRKEDHEYKSMSADKFRDVVIAQWTACQQAYDTLEKENTELHRAVIALERMGSRKSWMIEWLCEECKRKDPTFDDSRCRKLLEEDKPKEQKA